jgi:hypothetical protein
MMPRIIVMADSATDSVVLARRARYRQWQIHVLATWFDQFGRSGRVGCIS